MSCLDGVELVMARTEESLPMSLFKFEIKENFLQRSWLEKAKKIFMYVMF